MDPVSTSQNPSIGIVESAATVSETSDVATEGPFTFRKVPLLTAALKRGDESAYTWLYGQWRNRIDSYCLALTANNGALASEVSQAVWLKITRNIRVLDDETCLWNWIACAARHALIDQLRARGRYSRTLDRLAEWFSRPQWHTRPDSTVDLASALDSSLSQLTDTERSILSERYYSRDSLAEIANRHQLSERAIEGRLARTRKKLRKLIAANLKHQIS